MTKPNLARVARLAFTGRRTANAQTEEFTALQAQLEAQGVELEQLRRAAALPVLTEPPTRLAMLCRGANVPLEDVRWRVQAGLEPEQAVQAAVLQAEARLTQPEGGR